MPKEIKIYGVVGEGPNTKEIIREAITSGDTSEELVIRIDSEGGDVFDGFAIHDAIAAYPGPTKAIVESSAFSIASFIATACDQVEITPNGYFMLHNPAVGAERADDEELASLSESMAQLKQTMINAYAGRMKKTPEEIQAIMKRETFFSAEQSIATGLADRVLTTARASAIVGIENLPHKVYAALRSGGQIRETQEDSKMSESIKPVAATIREMKTICPGMKPEFYVQCAERELPTASVAAAAAEEMMKENEALKAQNEELTARIAAMEEEQAAKAKAQEEEQQQVEEEEQEARAAAKLRPGAKPIAKVSGGAQKPTASHRWKSAVQGFIDAGHPRHKAVALANRHNPGLREEFVEEVNSR